MKKYLIHLMVGVVFLMLAARPRPVHVFMAGDSTMANKTLTRTISDTITGESETLPYLERGWGQLLPDLLNDRALVVNEARNGRSSRTFIEEGWWSKIIDNIQKGDFIIIQFAHNDSSLTKNSRTNPVQFRLNFIAFIEEVRMKGATPILCTPVARRRFSDEGRLVPTHGVYPDIIRSVAKDTKTVLIDMEKLTSDWLQEAGVEPSRRFFHQFKPGENRLYPRGLDDNTHFNEEGARRVAELFIDEVKRQRVRSFLKLIK